MADAAVEQMAQQELAASDPLSAALDWLAEYEQMKSKRASAEDDKTIEAAVDKLLATDW